MTQQPQQKLREGLLNLDDVILQFAETHYEKMERKDLEKALGCKLPWGQLRAEIDTRELLVHTTVPSYAPESPAPSTATSVEDGGEELQSDEVSLVPDGQILRPVTSNSCVFRTVYTNACEHEVVNTINTARTTRAACSFRVTRALVLNRQLGLKLALPKDILEFNVGFSSQFSMESESSKTVEQEISWSVNTEVRVPGCHGNDGRASRVTAEIMIEEKEFKAKFTALTHLSGRVKVRLYTSDDRFLLPVVMPNLRAVFTQQLGFLHPRDPAASGKVAFITTGHCHSRFGVSQTVNILPSG